MKASTTRAALAALMIAASTVALTGYALAQDKTTTDSDGSRAGRPAGARPAAAATATPPLTSAVQRQLATAQTAMAAKKWADALPAVKAAQAEAKTDYDKLKVNQFLTSVTINMGDEAAATVAAEAAADLPPASIPAEDKQTVYYTAAALAINSKHNDKALAYAKQLIAINATDNNSKLVIPKAMYAGAPPQEAIAYFQKEIDAAVAAGQKPSRDSVDMKINLHIKAKDNAGAEKTLEQALALFNEPSDWDQMINIVMTTPGIRDIDAVMLGRLLFVVGIPVSKDNADLIGQTAQKLALYGDAQYAASKGGTGFTPDTARNNADKASMPQQIAEGARQNGTYNVKLAEALYGYGMYPETEAAARLALTKGGADNSEAQMLIGMSLYQQGKLAEAEAAFNQVQGGSPATPRIAHLWAIHSHIKANPAGGATAQAR